MPTYYGYVSRDADSYIDWSAIGTQLNKNISQVQKEREDKRSAFEKDARDSYNFLGDNPMGEDKSVNEYSLKLAGDAQSYLMQLQSLVKSGKMKMNDFLIKKQNLIDDATAMYGIMKSYQERAKEVSERTQKGLNQQFELEVFKQLEGFSNFDKTYAHIDPNTGRLWIAEKVKRNIDGKDIYTIPDTPTGNLQLVRSLAKTMKVNYDYYDMNGAAKKMVDSWGKEIKVIQDIGSSIYHTGRISEVMDITQRDMVGLSDAEKNSIKSFKDAETKMIESQLANPWNVTSILTNSMHGTNYTPTFNEDEAKQDPNKVLMKVQGGQYIPDFSTENGKKQFNNAVETMRTTLRMMYDHVEKPTTTPQEKDTEYERKQIDAEIEYKRGMLGVARTQAQNAAISNQIRALEAQRKLLEKQEKASKKTQPSSASASEIDANKLGAAIDNALGDPSWYKSDSPNYTKNNLIDKLKPLGNLGWTISGRTKGWMDDVITLRPPGAKSQPIEINIDDDAGWKDIIQALKDASKYDPEFVPKEWIKGKLD